MIIYHESFTKFYRKEEEKHLGANIKYPAIFHFNIEYTLYTTTGVLINRVNKWSSDNIPKNMTIARKILQN